MEGMFQTPSCSLRNNMENLYFNMY